MCPIFDFCDSSGETISVYLGINEKDKNAYQKQVRDGKVYKRVYSSFNFQKDVRVGDATKEDFRRLSQDKNVKVGDLWQKSKELAAIRAEKRGVDEVSEEFYKKHKKESGKDHPDIVKKKEAEARAKLKKEWGVSITPN